MGDKYLLKTSGDYQTKIIEILRNNFGSKSESKQNEIVPTEYTLYQNYPNPFNPSTTIRYDIPKSGKVELLVFDILGRKVMTLVDKVQESGKYEVNFNASYLASGVYIYQLRSESFVTAKKMILLK